MEAVDGELLSGIDETVLDALVEVEEVDAALRGLEYAYRVADPHGIHRGEANSAGQLHTLLYQRRAYAFERVLSLGLFVSHHKIQKLVREMAFKKLLHGDNNEHVGDGKIKLRLGIYLDRNRSCDCHNEQDIAREIEAVGIALGFECQAKNRHERALALLKQEQK